MVGGLILLAALQVGVTGAQTAPDSAVVVVPGARFRAGAVHRFFLGDTHRDLWATPIRVPVLDLGGVGGGLTAIEKGGSKQSRSLRFVSADGAMYVFRALEKDPTQTWPAALRASPARKLAEDQISAIFPAGAVAVAELERAAGLVNPGAALVVLPDDPRLGAWRSEFTGNVGILERRLRGSGESIGSIAGAAEVVTSDALYRRLRRDGRNVVDGAGYLAARLFDLVVGDWDRHGDQWSWARFDEGERRRWVPVPRDRDWALSRLDGPLYGLLRLYLPKYQTFGKNLGSVYGLTLSAEPLDRRLLTGIGRSTWDSVTRDLVARLDDRVIDRAVAALPAEFGAEPMARLAGALKARRDALPKASARFYRQLAGAVDLWGSDGDDRVTIAADQDGALDVTVATGAGAPRTTRRFVPGETGEIRLFLFGGADQIEWRGGDSPIRLRIVDPEGARPAGAPPGRIAGYDSTARFVSPVEPESPLAIHRDWGRLYAVAPWFEARPEIGMLVGGGPVIYTYGFRKVPYASRLAFRAAWATGAPGINLDFHGDFRFENPRRRLDLRASYLRTDVVRYFGIGNDTPRDQPASFYDVREKRYAVEPTLELGLGRHTTLGLGGFLRSSETDLERVTRLTVDRPYGSGEFTEAGALVGVTVDTRDDIVYPTRGIRLEASGQVAPALFDVAETYGIGRVVGAAFLTARAVPARPTLALRAGAAKAWGRTPFFEAPTVGGRGSVRGLNTRRFMGDGALWGSAELRLALGGYTLLVPGEWGIYGLADAGRVYLDGQASDTWHTAGGVGLWYSFLNRKSTMTVTYARAEERSRVYAQAGFHF